jgi:hypothetical protein
MDMLYEEEHGQAVSSGFTVLKTGTEGSYTASISVSHSQLVSRPFNSAHISPAATQSFPKLLHSQLNSWSKVSFFAPSLVSSFLILTPTYPSPSLLAKSCLCFLYYCLLPD